MADEVASGGIAAPSGAGTASPAAQTQTSTTSAAPAAQGTQTSGSTDSTPVEREGFIPRQRFDEVNGRMTEAEKQLADWKQYDWAKSVDRQQLSAMADWYGQYQGNPGEFIQRAYQEALQHPVHGASVKSQIAKMLASMRASQPQELPEIQPDIPVLNDQGQVVNHAYSAQSVKQLIERAVAQAIGKEVTPLREDLQSRTARDRQQAQAQQEHQYIAKESARIKADVLKLKDAEQHWPAIQTKARELITANADLSVGQACRDAYFSVVYPTLTLAAKGDVLSDLQKKAHSQTVNPGTSTPSAKPKFASPAEALRYYDAHPEEAAAMANR